MSDVDADPSRQDALRSLAADLGVELEYWDVQGRLHQAGTESLLGVLRSMGHRADDLADIDALRAEHDRDVAHQVVEPVVVADVGGPLSFVIRLPAGHRADTIEVVVALEAGAGTLSVPVSLRDTPGEPRSYGVHAVVEHRVHLGGDEIGAIPAGYHQLEVHGASSAPAAAHLLVAPTRVPRFAPSDRHWGVFAPVYALPGGSGIGAHLGQLARLAERVDAVGGKLVGTLPLLASWLDEPFEPSPYAPVSRLFWNELFVDLAALPELTALGDAQANLDGLRSIGHAANAKSRLFDYRHQYGYVHGVLEGIVGAVDRWPDRLRDDYEVWRAGRPDVERYACFRAYAAQAGTGWQQWPERPRRGGLDHADVAPEVLAFHTYAQYAMTRQLGDLAADLRARGQRLYLDLPIGVGGDGFDTWIDPGAYAWGAGTGAPPDEFFTEGQDWGLPPVLPAAARRSGHRAVAAVLRHHRAGCGVLRLDHGMGFHRRYWVPHGAGARDGVYVRYPSRELYAVLAIEAHRSEAVIVGENLGTVLPEVTEAMTRHDLLGMHVLEFNQPDWAGAEPVPADGDQLSSFGTHDTPTFAGWVHGFDIDQRHELQLLSDDEAVEDRVRRRQQVDNLRGFLGARGYPVDAGPRASRDDADRALLEGVLRYLGDSEAPAVLVSLDDLWLEPNPQNIPGTPVDRPNWVQRSPWTLDELFGDDDVLAILRAVQDCRLGSHVRAMGEDTP
jgi:4-alpha-glucanotransferase